jgi:hypothetical protein
MSGRDMDSTVTRKARTGRTPLLSVDKHEQIIDIVKANPKQIKTAINTIDEMFGKTIASKP